MSCFLISLFSVSSATKFGFLNWKTFCFHKRWNQCLQLPRVTWPKKAGTCLSRQNTTSKLVPRKLYSRVSFKFQCQLSFLFYYLHDLHLQTLSDDEKRSAYDNFGTTSAQQGQPHQGGGGGFDPFEQFFGGPFGGGGFRFNFGGHDSSVDKHRIGLRWASSQILSITFCAQVSEQIEIQWDCS